MITVTKLDAAHRQLKTAIQLWLEDGDPVSIHSLCYGAHQIVNDLSMKQGLPLLLNAPTIRKEMRQEFISIVKRDSNFFKHADARGKGKKSEPASIEFEPSVNELVIGITIHGLRQIGEALTDYEVAFDLWCRIHKPELFTRAWQDAIQNPGWAQSIASLPLQKKEFFEGVLKAQASLKIS